MNTLAHRDFPAPASTRVRGDETRRRLLDAAEELFAEKGISGVSLRDIVERSKTNIASVSYHFGSKENLFVQVFLRASGEFARALMDSLAAAGGEPGNDRLEHLIHAFLSAALTKGRLSGGRTSNFVRLRNWLAAENPPMAARLLSETQDHVGFAYVAALHEELPHLSRIDVVWRFHTMLGAMIYTVVHGGRLTALTDGQVDPDDMDEALGQLVSLLAGAFRAQTARKGVVSGRTSTRRSRRR